MPEHRPLQPASPWVQVVATDADWDAADEGLLRTIYAQLVWIRSFEQYVLDLAGAGLIHGPAHSSIGQEGGAVGSVLALTSEDSVNGSHRGHHQFLAKALHHVEPEGPGPLGRAERRDARGAPPHARRDRRTRSWVVARPGWVDAPAVEGSRRDGHQRDRRRRGAPGRRLRLVPPARRDRRGLRDLLRRRRHQHRLDPGDDEPRVRLGPPASASSSRTTTTPSPPRSRRPRESPGSRHAVSASTSRPGGSTAWIRSPSTWR